MTIRSSFGPPPKVEWIGRQDDLTVPIPADVLEGSNADRQRVVRRGIDVRQARENVRRQDARAGDGVEKREVDSAERALEVEDNGIRIRRADPGNVIEEFAHRLVVAWLEHGPCREDNVGRSERNAVRPLRVATQMVDDRLAVGADPAVAPAGDRRRQLRPWQVVGAAPQEPSHREFRDLPRISVEVGVEARVVGRVADPEDVRYCVGMAVRWAVCRPGFHVDFGARHRQNANGKRP